MYLGRAPRGLGSAGTRIARGLPVGGDLEYADDVTLIRALQGRRELMRELLFEIALRLTKAVAAAVLGLVVWLIAVGPLGATGSVELALLCWLSAAAFILLVEESPI